MTRANRKGLVSHGLFCVALTFGIWVGPVAAQMSSQQIAASKDDQVPASAVFQFGRTLYFNALVEKQSCIASFPQRTQMAQAGFRNATARLAKHFGAQFFNVEKPVDTSRSPEMSCDSATLGSYEQKVSELTAWADRADALKQGER